MDEELFQIGEVAKLYHLSVGTLRHYEQTGLLKPEFVDPATGYRYYSVRQFEQLTSIRYLRALGLPLSEITAYMHNRELDTIEDALRRQKELIRRKQQELELIRRKIDHRLDRLNEARSAQLDCIRLEQRPAMRVVWIRTEVKFNSYLWLERSIREIEQDQEIPLSYLGKVGVGVAQERLQAGQFDGYDRVFLVLDEEDVYRGRVERLPACECAAVRFRGSHEKAAVYYARLMQYLAQQQREVAGFSREIALIDNCVSSDPEQYVTEISIPVRKKA